MELIWVGIVIAVIILMLIGALFLDKKEKQINITIDLDEADIFISTKGLTKGEKKELRDLIKFDIHSINHKISNYANKERKEKSE